MNLICPRCRTTNEPDAHFCKICGTGFDVKPIRQNSITTPVIIIVAIIAVCGFCGLFGLINGSKNEVVQSNSSVKIAPVANVSENISPVKKLVESPDAPKFKNGAVVISGNANLRQTPNSGGEVIQTLPGGASVEIIKQKEAWFYVRANNQTGWMHGNTIRLNAANSAESPAIVPADAYTAPKITRSAPEPVINNSGATAKCSDGTLSYSAHRRGTCSHHGGVAQWY